MPSSGFNCTRDGWLVISNTNLGCFAQQKEAAGGVCSGDTAIV